MSITALPTEQLISPWTTSALPTSTLLKSIDPTNTAGLIETFTSAASYLATGTAKGELVQASKYIRGAQASMSIISAQEVLATETNTQIESLATEIIFNSTVNLDDLHWENNLFDYYLNRPANIIYFTLFSLLFLYYLGMCIKSRYIWFNVTFTCGYVLEFLGFLGRILAFIDWTDMNYFLIQFICLTIAPAFIMAGIYFNFGQLVIVHGRQYSLLKPLWYTYLFITCDVLSLVIQAAGGGMAAVATSSHKDASSGTNTMIAGIAFQVVAMSIFLFFWFTFLYRIYFCNPNSKNGSDLSNSPMSKKSLKNYLSLLFNTKAAKSYKINELEEFYNPKYQDLRVRPLTSYYPLAMTIGTVCVYIRCVYRVVELAQGWSGYLITTEVFLMVLDALMIAICGLVFVPFHPLWVFGKENRLQVKSIKRNLDNVPENKFTYEKASDDEQPPDNRLR